MKSFINDGEKPEDYECAICREDYNLNNKLPVQLNGCKHVFCSPCIKNLFLNYKKHRCPNCRFE